MPDGSGVPLNKMHAFGLQRPLENLSCFWFIFGQYMPGKDGDACRHVAGGHVGAAGAAVAIQSAGRRAHACNRIAIDQQGVGRSHREAPEIDGVVHVGQNVPVGEFAEVEIVDALGPDLVAEGVDLNDLEDRVDD